MSLTHQFLVSLRWRRASWMLSSVSLKDANFTRHGAAILQMVRVPCFVHELADRNERNSKSR